MKFSISVPDDLWRQVARDSAQGPSDIVQQALRTLAAQQRRATGPMANAPDPARLDHYRPAFNEAVARVAGAIRDVQDSGYRFGMLLASGLAMTDFDILEQADAPSQIMQLVESAAPAGARIEGSDDLLSESLHDRCAELTVQRNGETRHTRHGALGVDARDAIAQRGRQARRDGKHGSGRKRFRVPAHEDADTREPYRHAGNLERRKRFLEPNRGNRRAKERLPWNP